MADKTTYRVANLQYKTLTEISEEDRESVQKEIDNLKYWRFLNYNKVEKLLDEIESLRNTSKAYDKAIEELSNTLIAISVKESKNV